MITPLPASTKDLLKVILWNIENVGVLCLVGGSMFEAAPFTITFAAGNPKPKGMSYMKSWFAAGMLLSTPTLTGVGFLQLNQGTRFGDPTVPLVLSAGQTMYNFCSFCIAPIDTTPGGTYVSTGGFPA